MTKREEIFINACKTYVSKKNSTIRSISQENGLCKSTLHKFMHDKLKNLDLKLYRKVMKKIKINISLRHINGGKANKERCLRLKSKK